MSLGTLRRFLSGLLLGGACGATMFAIAAVSGYSLAQVHMTRVAAPRGPTPTVEEIQRALEQRTGEPYPLITPTPEAAGPTPSATAVNDAGTPEPPTASAALRSATPVPLEQSEEVDATPSVTPTPSAP
jgi:hypothetical protein